MTRPGPEPDAAGGKRRSLRPLVTLLPYLARHKAPIAAALVALVVAAGATLTVPLAVRRMIDFGFSAENAAFVDRYFLALGLVVLVLSVASAARYYTVTVLGERVVADLRADVFAHLVSLDQAFFDGAKTGELVSRLTADTGQIRSAVGASASVALRNLVLFVGATVMMVVTSPGLSGLVLLAIPAMVLPLVGFGRVVRRRSRAAQDTLADASAAAAEAIASVRTLQSFTAERRAAARFAAAVERAYHGARRSTLARSVLTGTGILLVFSSVVAVLWYGAQDVLAGRITVGALGQFVLYAVFAAGALGELAQVWGELAQASGAAERLAELLALKPAIAPPRSPAAFPEPPRGTLAFEAVRFAYPTRAQGPVLAGVSFAVRAGETVAVVGPSGAGKSTLFQLAQRFYDPVEGRVLIDGVDLALADPGEARRRVAIVPQETTIFGDTILENIRFGRPEASDAEVVAAARLALVSPFAEAFREGYLTPVGERGVTLSGGERQRIAIARAILKDAPILLLDEATSALDAESEALVQGALERLMRGRTTLVIAHRLATVVSADRILVMEGGRMVEEGTHAALLARDGLYARLARLQLQAEAA